MTTPSISPVRSENLSAEQLARADALDRARSVLVARSPLSSAAVDPIDLVNVAGWIIDGRDPWGEKRDAPESKPIVSFGVQPGETGPHLSAHSKHDHRDVGA